MIYIYYQYIIWFIILIYHMIYNMKVRVYHFEDKDEVRWNGFRKSVWEFLWMILHQAKVSLDMTKISIGCTLGHAADPKSIWSSHFLPVQVPSPHHPSLISADGSHFGPHVINWYLICVRHWVKTSFGVQIYRLNWHWKSNSVINIWIKMFCSLFDVRFAFAFDNQGHVEWGGWWTVNE